MIPFRKTGRTVLLFLSWRCLWAQAPALDSELDQKISATRMAFDVPSVSVAIVQDGNISYTRAIGKADIQTNRSAEPDTRYAIGSISKQFTSAALLLEQERGKLTLDDKVANYLPDLTRASDVTIRQLLSHTSGYEDYAPQDYLIPEWTHPINTDEIMSRWAKKPLNFNPGTKWQYSNTNYVIAARILEKVSGQQLVPFLKQNIFDVLGMTSAGDCQVHSPRDASAYTRFALGPPRPVGREAADWYLGAAELCMTASDLARWDIAFLEKKVLSPRSYDEFTREVKLSNGDATHYALGLDLGDFQGTASVSHTGEVSGFLAANTLYPAKHIGIVVLSNEDGVNLIGPMTQELSGLVLNPSGVDEKRNSQIRAILEDLQKGKIDRAQFSENANSYFSDTALSDYKNSLAPLGDLVILSKRAEDARGGMTYLGYRAHFQKNTVTLSIYILPDGKIEQFLVGEQF